MGELHRFISLHVSESENSPNCHAFGRTIQAKYNIILL